MRWPVIARLAITVLAAGLLIGVAPGAMRLGAARSLSAAESPAQPAKTQASRPAPPERPSNAMPACPPDMLLVEGGYCPEVFHQCLDYEPERGSLPSARCRRYAEPAECASARVPMRFCIDRVEYSATEAELPDNRQSLLDATQACQSTGKRLCRDDEWTFACEGEAMQPYPYGFALNDSACGTGRTDLMDSRGKLSDHRRVRGSLERCASPFGVRDLAGNLEEHVVRAELPADVRRLPREQSVLKGAWWQPGDHRCRAGQTAHDQFYKGTETGFRCCKQPAAGAT